MSELIELEFNGKESSTVEAYLNILQRIAWSLRCSSNGKSVEEISKDLNLTLPDVHECLDILQDTELVKQTHINRFILLPENDGVRTSYRHFELILAMVKVFGPLSHAVIYSLLTKANSPIKHPRQAIATLVYCGFLRSYGVLSLSSEEVIALERAMELLKIYGIERDPFSPQPSSRIIAFRNFEELLFLYCTKCHSMWKQTIEPFYEYKFSIKGTEGNTRDIRCLSCGNVRWNVSLKPFVPKVAEDAKNKGFFSDAEVGMIYSRNFLRHKHNRYQRHQNCRLVG